MKLRLLGFAALMLSFVSVTNAQAVPITGTYTLGGTTTGTGPWDMTSTDSTFAVLRFVLDTPVEFDELMSLSYDYDSLMGGIGGGSPRVAFVTSTNQSFLLHWGPAGSFVDPTIGNNLNTGNLLSLFDNGRYDLSGIGGSAYTDRATALALAGNMEIVRLSLLIDSFGGNDRHFVIDGVNVEGVRVADAVPEPATLVLFGTGLAATVWVSRRREKKTNG